MDRSLSGGKQVNHVCRIVYAQLKSLSKIKCFINHESNPSRPLYALLLLLASTTVAQCFVVLMIVFYKNSKFHEMHVTDF